MMKKIIIIYSVCTDTHTIDYNTVCVCDLKYKADLMITVYTHLLVSLACITAFVYVEMETEIEH